MPYVTTKYKEYYFYCKTCESLPADGNIDMSD